MGVPETNFDCAGHGDPSPTKGERRAEAGPSLLLERRDGRRHLRPTVDPMTITFMAKQHAHKPGANRDEAARKTVKQDKNFSQSKDIHEDRGERQIKNINARTFPHPHG
jgi:hypothetical protein